MDGWPAAVPSDFGVCSKPTLVGKRSFENAENRHLRLVRSGAKTTAKRLLVRLLKMQGVAPKRMITDKLRSYAAAKRQIMPTLEHRSHKGLNNRAENSHLPLRKRERVMQGFRSSGSLQRFLSAFSALRNLFVPPRTKRTALAIHLHRISALAHWKSVTDVAA